MMSGSPLGLAIRLNLRQCSRQGRASDHHINMGYVSREAWILVNLLTYGWFLHVIYCHCTLYLANHDPSTYVWSKPALAAFFISYLFVYRVWDTASSQKNSFRMMERGTFAKRKSFSQLPWREIHNPKTIVTENGDTIPADGWYGLARKVHYSCDTCFALSLVLITGFDSPFPLDLSRLLLCHDRSSGHERYQ